MDRIQAQKNYEAARKAFDEAIQQFARGDIDVDQLNKAKQAMLEALATLTDALIKPSK